MASGFRRIFRASDQWKREAEEGWLDLCTDGIGQ
eukprot:SAG31_NODE_46561_length_254_cov_0.638710_1_plen_33_part_10